MAPRIAYFTLPVQGHISPSLPVVAELVARGAQVDAFATPRYSEPLRMAGAAFHSYPDGLAEHADSPPGNPVEVAALLAGLAEESLLEFATVSLRELRPDVVIVDSMAPWGRLAARRLGLPVATSTSSFVIHAGIGATPVGAVEMLRSVGSAVRAATSLQATRRRMRRTVGLDPGGPLSVLSNRGDTTIVYTSRALQPGGARFGQDVRFVGATLASEAAVADDELLAAIGPGPLTYVSLGTIYNDRAAFLRACIAGLAGDGRTVVVAAGSRVAADALGPLPAGVHVTAFAPQLALLEQAELFVTHGGMNSVTEALWHGVPMLVFPQAADQPVVAARIQQLGAARVLRGREPDAQQLRRAAGAVLAGGAAAAAAAQLGAGLRAGGGAPAAADGILALVPARG